MLSIISADVPEAVWDQTKKIIVVPLGLTEQEICQQMVRLFCERDLCGHNHAAEQGAPG
jgi:hypothetical protein